MENTCSFLAIVGGKCGHENKDRMKSIECVSLLSCKRDITAHKSAFSFSGVENEVELILARSSIFSHPTNSNELVICPAHTTSLGIGWRRDSVKCRIPDILSHHGDKRPKAERGLSKSDYQFVLKECGIFLAAGSGKSMQI